MKDKNIFAKGHTPIWLKIVKSTLTWTYVIEDFYGKEILETFYGKYRQKLQKPNQTDLNFKR